MLFMRKTTALPSAAEALPGRAKPIPSATSHFVNGHRLQPPYPAGLEQAVFGLGCFYIAPRSTPSATRSAKPLTRPARPIRRRWRQRGWALSPPKSLQLANSPRTIISNIWRRIRPAIAGWAVPACPARDRRRRHRLNPSRDTKSLCFGLACRIRRNGPLTISDAIMGRSEGWLRCGLYARFVCR